MLQDTYNRMIDYLRTSVTDRCNLRCIYCMPEYGFRQKPPSEILSFEEITKIAELAVSMGINKIKITGGEPLVRKGLPQLLSLLSSIPGLKDLSLTTNGILLQRYIRELKDTRLKRINISIDTLDTEKFRRITKTGQLTDVLKGIDAAIEEGFFVKLNVVIMKEINDDEILRFVSFAKTRQIIVRFIELMPMINNNKLIQDLYISCNEIKDRLSLLGNLKPIVLEDFGNGPAQYYRIESLSVIVGFISPVSFRFCFNCNRLRLTADGLLMPCLNSRVQLDLKTPLRENKEKEIQDLFKKAIFLKPQGHNFTSLLQTKTFSTQREYLMSQIGG